MGEEEKQKKEEEKQKKEEEKQTKEEEKQKKEEEEQKKEEEKQKKEEEKQKKEEEQKKEALRQLEKKGKEAAERHLPIYKMGSSQWASAAPISAKVTGPAWQCDLQGMTCNSGCMSGL